MLTASPQMGGMQCSIVFQASSGALGLVPACCPPPPRGVAPGVAPGVAAALLPTADAESSLLFQLQIFVAVLCLLFLLVCGAGVHWCDGPRLPPSEAPLWWAAGLHGQAWLQQHR